MAISAPPRDPLALVLGTQPPAGREPAPRQRVTATPTLLLCALLTATLAMACGGGGGEPDVPRVDRPPGAGEPTPSANWRLVWNDEFEGDAGAAVDASKWTCAVGGNGWGQDELDYATNCSDPQAPNFTTANAAMDGNGHLVIRALPEEVPHDTCWYGACTHTSARLITAFTLTRQHGRYEVRVKTPPGRGLWPGIWLVGQEIRDDYWGEIDILEVIGGRYPRTIFQAAHGPGFVGEFMSNGYTLPDAEVSEAFHTYAVDWWPDRLDFWVDELWTFSVTPDSLPGRARWPFNDQPFYLLMNLAVGSRTSWSEAPDESTPFPAEMLVDYVRVYDPD